MTEADVRLGSAGAQLLRGVEGVAGECAQLLGAQVEAGV
jgi:hypothetical protein